jgi:hypothetical protein
VYPTDTYPLANVIASAALAQLVHAPDDFMARDNRQLRRRRATLDLVELGVANAANGHLDENFAAIGHRAGNVTQLQRLAVIVKVRDFRQDHGSHPGTPLRLQSHGIWCSHFTL